MLRLVWFVVLLLAPIVLAAPRPPADPCARAAFRELEAVQARIRALAAGGSVTLTDILELAMDLPTSYVWQAPGGTRFRDLFAATDPKIVASILTDIANDLDAVLATSTAWRYRCGAYPTSHVAPKAPTRKQLAARRAIAKRTVAWVRLVVVAAAR